MVEGRPAPESAADDTTRIVKAAGIEEPAPGEPKVVELDPKVLGATPDALFDFVNQAFDQRNKVARTVNQQVAFVDFSTAIPLSTTSTDDIDPKAAKRKSAEPVPASFLSGTADITATKLEPPAAKKKDEPITVQQSNDGTATVTPVKVKTVRVTSSDPIEYVGTFKPVEAGTGYVPPKFEQASFVVQKPTEQVVASSTSLFDQLKTYIPQPQKESADGRACDVSVSVASNSYVKPDTGGGPVAAKSSSVWDAAFTNPTPIAYQKIPFAGATGQREGSNTEGPTVASVMENYGKIKSNQQVVWDSAMLDKTPVAQWGNGTTNREIVTAARESAGKALETPHLSGAAISEEARRAEGSFQKPEGLKEVAAINPKDGLTGLPSNAAGSRELVNGGPQMLGKDLGGAALAGPQFVGKDQGAAALAAARLGTGETAAGQQNLARLDANVGQRAPAGVQAELSPQRAQETSPMPRSSSISLASAAIDLSLTAKKENEHTNEKLMQLASTEHPGKAKADEQASPVFRPVYIPSVATTEQAVLRAVEHPRFSETSLARVSSQAAAIVSMESLTGKPANGNGDRSAAQTAGERGPGIIPTDRTIMAGNSQAVLSGPVTLSTLRQALEAVAQSPATNQQQQASARAIETAQALAASQSGLISGRAQAQVPLSENSANILTGGRGAFADPSTLNSRQIFDASGKSLIANPVFNPGSIAAINNPGTNIGNVRGIAQSSAQVVEGSIQSASGRLDPISGRPLIELIGPDGSKRKSDLNIDEIMRIQKTIGSGDRRYLTGVEIALAVAIASAAVAKHKPQQQEGELASDELKTLLGTADSTSGNGADSSDPSAANNNAQTANLFKRPVHTVAHSDTLIDIAESFFQNPDVAWLIADINKGRITEHEDDGKRIIELRSRQQIEIPLPSEVEEFLLTKSKEIKGVNLVTFVSVSEIDRELLDSFLSTVVGGDNKEAPELKPAEPYLDSIRPEVQAPATQPLLQLINFGKTMGQTLMPSMTGLLKQGQNLRTYISKIDLLPPENVVNLKPEPQR